MTRLPVNIRWMRRNDLSDVLAIEDATRELPWGLNEFLNALRVAEMVAFVAEAEGQVLGYMVAGMFRGYLRVLNLAVRPDVQRCEIGMQLMEKLSGKLSDAMPRIVVRVPETNLVAQKFFAAAGLRARGVIWGDRNELSDDQFEFEFCRPVYAEMGS